MAVRNLDRLKARLAKIPAGVRAELSKALDQSAAEIVGMQKRLVPKKTGALANSIVATQGGERVKYSQGVGGGLGDPDLSVRISAGNSAVRYAHLVEFGTKPHEVGGLFEGAQHPGSRAKPFFYPPYRALKKRSRGRITRAGAKAAKQIAAGK
ncbi:HK97-gp10 family putative phage morphogenesis protein [Enterovirga aerilata]|uniref:HK97 gp10 family phage protein n=1 Tax=Enterovirga aerilata TaxID=2730920 RepID=A0A849I5C3_9HYPH|nr:HK97-gp10 family putative phage morphogenesis protein [Enterovirga sp. DB1703]NNM75056.1 HK97 gp10 family phage protein [Enterovirga sp. DB1703]